MLVVSVLRAGQESRRDRNRRIDMGDDSAKLKIQGHGGHGGHGGQNASHSDSKSSTICLNLSKTADFAQLLAWVTIIYYN